MVSSHKILIDDFCKTGQGFVITVIFSVHHCNRRFMSSTDLDFFLVIFLSDSSISAEVMTKIALMCKETILLRYFSMLLTCLGGSYFLKPFRYFQSLAFIHCLILYHRNHSVYLCNQPKALRWFSFLLGSFSTMSKNAKCVPAEQFGGARLTPLFISMLAIEQVLGIRNV